MKKIIVYIALVFLTTSSFAQKDAKIEFSAMENTIDYGRVSKNSDSGIRVFEFTNTGDAPLIITNVLTSWGGKATIKPETPIMPGKKGKIEIKYNMTVGPIRKTITVETNAINYEEGRIALKIKGEVILE